MMSGKQKALYLVAGGVTASAIVWLGYSRSASGTRRFLGTAGHSVKKRLGEVQGILSRIQSRTEDIDRLAHELVQAGSEQKNRAEEVLSNTMYRLEQMTGVIKENLTQSSQEIAGLVKDIREGVARTFASRPSQAA